MKKLIYLSISILICACSPSIGIPPNNKVYYKFTKIDYENIPTKYSQIGIINVYKNSSGESISVKNESYEIIENTYLNGEIFGTEYYYDQLFIRLRFSSFQVNNDFDIKIAKYNTNTLDYKISTQNLEQTLGGSGRYFFLSLPKEYNLLFEKVINNISFKKVKLLELDGAFLKISNGVNINKIYFDLKGGIIGLEDSSNNNQFWISN